MVRSVTTFDPEWTDEDIDAALAWADDEALRCPGCGLHRDETMQPGGEHLFDAEPVVCHGCAERDRRRGDFQKKKGDTAGVFWRVFRIPGR